MRRKFRLTFYYSDMPLTNNVMIVRHKLLTNLIKLWKDNQLVERIDRLPIELSPRRSKHAGRCCVHKERAVWKYKSFPLMGFDMSDETDELTPLSEYARKALERKGQQQKDLPRLQRKRYCKNDAEHAFRKLCADSKMFALRRQGYYYR